MSRPPAVHFWNGSKARPFLGVGCWGENRREMLRASRGASAVREPGTLSQVQGFWVLGILDSGFTLSARAGTTIERGKAMDLDELNKGAEAMVAPGKGILAADESSGTIKKRFDAIGVESTEDNRRDYREMLFRSTEGMKHISGVILYDETIWQKAKDGTPLVELVKKAGAIPGIKVDEGTKPLPMCPGEVVTIGLDK